MFIRLFVHHFYSLRQHKTKQRQPKAKLKVKLSQRQSMKVKLSKTKEKQNEEWGTTPTIINKKSQLQLRSSLIYSIFN